MFYLLFFLSFICSVSADEFSLAVTENDPSTLVEGVSVITGDLYSFEEDYIVQGAEPIRLRRSFLSSEGVFKTYEHLTATFFCEGNCFFVKEHSGTTLYYHADPQNRIHPQIGEHFYGDKKKHSKPLRYNAHEYTQTSKGVANTSSGKMSAQTHLKNQYMVLDPTLDKEGKSFTLYASDGTKRRYEHLKGQKRLDLYPSTASYLIYQYKLVSETLPNGHIIHYDWDSENRVDRIYTTNASKTKTYAQLTIPVFSPLNPPAELTLTGSDACSITYKAHPTEVKHLYVQCDVLAPDLPNQHFGWDMKPRWIRGQEQKMPYMRIFSLPNQRVMKIGYSDVEDPSERQSRIDAKLKEIRQKIEEMKPDVERKPKKYGPRSKQLKDYEKQVLQNGVENEGYREGYRVKVLSSPVGKDGSLITTHTFFYDKASKNSYVLDAQNNKTAYLWNEDYRLTHIHRYEGREHLHSSDTFLWENTHLRCKTFLDQHANPVFSRSYLYDERGNVKEETFYGNLSGQGCSLKIGSNGLPEDNGAEKFTKQFTYSDDGRNLLIRQQENKLCIKHTYRSDYQLPLTKSICDEEEVKIQTTYEYDDDLILRSETVDDGISKVMKKITPLEKGPYIGMPEVIEEFDGNGLLLSKKVLHYGKGALIEKKDVYDANNKLRYVLEMSYDDKGRLIRETNALGQEAIFQYDEVGNRKYAKDFSGRLETFYEYDFSNRLKVKEEKGDDGVHRIFQYDYDVKHNLVSETDPYGNQTTYIPDAFGHRKEIHLPQMLDEKGDLISSVIKYQYDSAGNQIEKTDASGCITRTNYNAYGKPILITHPDSATEEFSYDLDGNLKSHTDPKKVVTQYEYDYLGRVTKKTISGGVEIFEYTGQHLTKKIDAEKNATTYKYDRAGRKISEEFAGEETLYTYDEFGRLRTTQKGDLLTVTDYDLLGRVTEERNESANGIILRKVTYEYDLAGHRKAIIRSVDGKEAREEFTYDSVGRLIQKKDPLGFVETYEYDPKVNRKIHTDPMGLQTIETYNPQNRLASIEKKNGDKTLVFSEKFYNENGALAQQIDTVFAPNGTQRKVRTCWQYNPRGLLKTLTEAEGTLDAKITHYTYTPRGELETVTKPNRVVLTYQYNDLGHLTSLSSSDGTVNHRMEYNLLGHLQKSDELVRKTDPFGRILKERFPRWHTIENTYDQRGRRDTCKISAAGCLITYEYDPVHLKKVTRKTLDGTALYSHSYTKHDLSGNVLEEELIQNGGTLQHTFDPLSRKTALISPQFTQKIIEFDGTGNIRKMLTGSDEISYTYDDLYQLTSESGLFSHSYTFDSINNRTQKDEEHYEINPLNQISSHFKYDLNGNPIQHDQTTYTYDALDRLIKIETPEFIQTFTYDSFHRCLTKTTSHWCSPKTVYFIYDGQNEIGALDESASPLELRILGHAPHAEIGAAIAIELNRKIHLPIHDLQGNIAALQPINSDPTLYRYSAFGEEKIFGQAISPWRFSSKRSDSQSQLVYFGRRYYIPSFGRWLTPDPAGFTDGMNLYAYVHNNPLMEMDLYGLWGEYQPWTTSYQSWHMIQKAGIYPSSNAHYYSKPFVSAPYTRSGYLPQSYIRDNNGQSICGYSSGQHMSIFRRNPNIHLSLESGAIMPDYTFFSGFVGKGVDPIFRSLGKFGKKAFSKTGSFLGNAISNSII